MDINIVNTILRLCHTQQTCLFEVPSLSDYCLEQRLCTNSKFVLASIRNYMEIFKISRDRTRIEFFMPFEICRNNYSDGLCQNNGEPCPNLHVCYDYFSTNVCRRSMTCPYAHQLSERYHENILGTLINLDLDALTKAFRVFCQSKRHILGHNSAGTSASRGQQQQQPSSSSSFANNSNVSSSSSSSANNWRLTSTPQISSNSSWKTNNRTSFTTRVFPTQQQQQQQTINLIPDKGLQIYWTPQKHIQTHFVEVVFSNQGKSGGGLIHSHTIYQHLGIGQLFYQNSEIVDRVIRHGPVTFQSFTFIPRILQRAIDLRHICFSNMPIGTIPIPLYIDAVSTPYKKASFEYYQNDKQTIVVEYKEDIDFTKISSNLRNHPEYNTLAIKCIQLYHPETLFVEYNQDYSEYDIKQLFKNKGVFHIKTYSFCAFVHFYSHEDLMRSIQVSFDNPIKVTPIYIDIYSQRHLDNYLQQRQNEVQSNSIPIDNQSVPSTNGEIEEEEQNSEPSLPVVPSVIIDNQETEIPPESESPVEEKTFPILPETTIDCKLESEPSVEPNDLLNDENDENDIDEENEIPASDDDFHDLQSEFDNDDLFLDEFVDNNGDMEFLRSAAKNLMSSLAEMEAASASMNTMDAPHSLLYGDDYVVTIKSRRFALAFLDYTQFRVEKQRNPDKFRLLAALKKNAQMSNNNSNNQKKRNDDKQGDDTPSPVPTIEPDLIVPIETKTNKKKRNKRNKKKKIINNDKPEPTPESINEEEDDEDDNTIHVLNDQEFGENHFSIQRLPHIYFDNDLKPCIVVAGEEHSEDNEQDTGDHEDWHNIAAGGKSVLVPKKTKKKKQQQQQKDEKPKVEPKESNSTASNGIAAQSQPPPPAESNSINFPINCRGFVHNPKSNETFRLRLRRSFPSINIRFQPDTYTITIDGNNKSSVQQCLTHLNSLVSFKRSFLISYDGKFPQTTITNIIRMQQSTAQVKLDTHANYDRIFRSTDRLLDYQLKQQYYQQQCIYCRRSQKQFQITYLEFPSEKQTIEEFNETVQQRILQLLNTRFTYIAIALSAELMTTKRWAEFYKNLSKHKELDKTILIRKLDTIIQVYGLHANVQQIKTSITKFLDTNRYETDVIETEQASGLFSILKKDFQDMENLDIFREAELRFVYRHHRHVLLVQCFQEKFETVKSRLEKLRSQLSTVVQPVKSSVLSRYYSKSNEIQRIAAASNCMITIEQRGDHVIDLKIIGRSPERAQRLIKEFEEQKYSIQKVHNHDIHLFTEQDLKDLENECSTCNVSYKIDQNNNLIELEGLSGDFNRIEKAINDLCSIAARRALDDIQYSTQWVYYQPPTNKPMAFGEIIKQQLEKSYTNKQKGLVTFKDHTNQNRTFDLDKMVEIRQGNNPNNPIHVKIERRDLKNPQAVQLPPHWSAMTNTWERVFLARRDNTAEWKGNNEIQRVLRLPHMLPEPWIIEIYRIQNPRMFQQYIAHRENFAARSQDVERTLYRLAQLDKIDDMCAHGFNRSHTDIAFSAYGHGCHFYCKAIDIDRTVTLLAQNLQPTPIMLQQQTPSKPPVRFLFVCKVLVGRYTRGDSSMKTCPPGYDSLVNDIQSPEVFVTHQDAQVLPEYLIAYQSAIF